MSSFATWQPRYAAHHISTFPVAIIGDRKKPMVSGYLKLDARVSQQLVMRFPDADALGFALGIRSRVTVLDVDSPDERVLADALNRHGDTPIVVRSGSGNFQGWFRHNGEGRKIRPFAKEPIDILGGGFTVAPPSAGSRRSYEWIAGGLDDLDRLPVLRNLPSDIVLPEAKAASTRSDVGRRNDQLWRTCMALARRSTSCAELIEKAQKRNEEFMPPLSESEVVKVASSAWRYETEGRNFIAGSSSAILRHTVIDRLAASDLPAFALFCLLQRHHWDRKQFAIANDMAATINWPIDRLRGARNSLVAAELIRCVHPGGRGRNDPAIYEWP
jgi:hypothetical protein